MLAYTSLLAACLLVTVARAVENITFAPPFDHAKIVPDKDLIKVTYPNKDYWWTGSGSAPGGFDKIDWVRVPITEHTPAYTAWVTNNDTSVLSKSLKLFGGGGGANWTKGSIKYAQGGSNNVLNASNTYRIVLSEILGQDVEPKQILGYSSLFKVDKSGPPPPMPTNRAGSGTVQSLTVFALGLMVACAL